MTLYYRAVRNNMNYHVAARLRRGRTIIREDVNRRKSHPLAKRYTPDGQEVTCRHAEIGAITKAPPGDSLEVYRWLKNGQLTMARPCDHCAQMIKKKQIRKVTYSDWEGNMVTVNAEAL